jgi:integrase
VDADQFCAYLAMSGMADNTIRNYRAMMLRWADYAIGRGADPWQPDILTVRAFATQLPGGRSLRAHARATISHLCRALEQPDVSVAIPLPRKTAQIQPLLSHAATVLLLDQADQCGIKGLAVQVALYTAARRSEVASLAWRRVDLDRNTVTLERAKTRDLHTVPLHPALREVLEPRKLPGELWVFPGRNGGHVTPATIWQWILEVGEAAGVGKVTPHMLRRTALTEVNEQTLDLRAAQQFAGHVDPAVTATYTRVSQQRLQDAVKALNWTA